MFLKLHNRNRTLISNDIRKPKSLNCFDAYVKLRGSCWFWKLRNKSTTPQTLQPAVTCLLVISPSITPVIYSPSIVCNSKIIDHLSCICSRVRLLATVLTLYCSWRLVGVRLVDFLCSECLSEHCKQMLEHNMQHLQHTTHRDGANFHLICWYF